MVYRTRTNVTTARAEPNFQLHATVIPSRREFRHEGVTSAVMTIGGCRPPRIRLQGHLSSCKEFSGINHAGWSSIFSPSAATFKFIYIYIYVGTSVFTARGDPEKANNARARADDSYNIIYYYRIYIQVLHREECVCYTITCGHDDCRFSRIREPSERIYKLFAEVL